MSDLTPEEALIPSAQLLAGELERDAGDDGYESYVAPEGPDPFFSLAFDVVCAAARVGLLDRERRERVDPDLRAALYDLSVVGWNLARITPEGDRIEPLPEVWHRLDEALEQARAALDATPDHTVVGEEREAITNWPTPGDNERPVNPGLPTGVPCREHHRLGFIAAAPGCPRCFGTRATPRPR